MKLTQNLLNDTDRAFRRRISLLVILLVNSFLFAQVTAQTVTGKVVDTSGEPLIGANVLVKGTANGTMTDFDGNYSINVSGESPVLVFSYLGYLTKEIEVAGNTQVNATLEEDANALDEVTVVGYGTQRKSDITSAVSSVKAEEIEGFALARVDQALQGKTSGVYVLNSDGSPGGNTIIRIRGVNSINGGNEPLIVIDGLQGGNIDNINPNDIESVEILKDASATSIYGSRGANGVVLVTTKQGKLGKPVIELSTSYSTQEIIRKLPMLSGGEFARLVNLSRLTDTYDGRIPQPVFTDEQIAAFDAGPSYNAQDYVYKTGHIRNTQLTISGATEKLRYLVSGNYLDQTGILLNSGFNRANLRLNLSADITDAVKFGINYNFVRSNATSPSFRDEVGYDGQVVNVASRWTPTEALFNEDGTYRQHPIGYGTDEVWNPIASAQEPIHDNPTYINNGNLFLDFKILEGLNLRISGGGIMRNSARRRFLNTKTLPGFSRNGEALLVNERSEYFQNSNILTYDKSFDKHKLKFTGVIEQSTSKVNGHRIEAQDFTVEDLGFDLLESANVISERDSWARERSLLSYVGRVNYSFDDKYLLTATYRADASSVFGADNKWGYFPSASVAWKASEESFIKDAVDHMDLKLRYSWGVTGNQGIAPYESLARLGSGTTYPIYGADPSSVITGFGLSDYENPELKWESTTQTNFGVDLGLFNNRLTATFDVYKKTTEDLLMPQVVPLYYGVETIISNVGSVENKGFEFTISGDPIRTNDFSWNSSFNISANRNKVLDLNLDEGERIPYVTTLGGYGVQDAFMVLEEGQPFGTMRGYIFDGIWSVEDEAEARSYGQLPGMRRYRDVNGDGEVNEDDVTVMGNAYPDFTWGWTNNLEYKNFGLSFMFIGAEGMDLFNMLRIRRERGDEVVDPRALNYWTPENQDTDIPGYIDGAYIQAQGLTNRYTISNNATSQYVEDASFIRLKTIQLSYNFDKDKMKWMDTIGINSLNLYVSGTNLFTSTDYTGYDPEVAAFAGNDASLGVDFSAYPSQKTYTFGARLSF